MLPIMDSELLCYHLLVLQVMTDSDSKSDSTEQFAVVSGSTPLLVTPATLIHTDSPVASRTKSN